MKELAVELGFDLCGVAPVDAFPELSFYQEWLAKGYAGEMAYLHRTASRRADVREVMPGARSVIVLGTVYNTDRPVLDRDCVALDRLDRALCVGRRLPRRDPAHGCRVWSMDARRRRADAVRGARATSTPGRCRSASTRSTPASAGSARTPA